MLTQEYIDTNLTPQILLKFLNDNFQGMDLIRMEHGQKCLAGQFLALEENELEIAGYNKIVNEDTLETMFTIPTWFVRFQETHQGNHYVYVLKEALRNA